VPDDADYEVFFGLLACPETWSEEDRRAVEFQLRQQRAALEASNPKDVKRTESLTGIVESIESALVWYRARSHP
jgi:hypothetical protein